MCENSSLVYQQYQNMKFVLIEEKIKIMDKNNVHNRDQETKPNFIRAREETIFHFLV